MFVDLWLLECLEAMACSAVTEETQAVNIQIAGCPSAFVEWLDSEVSVYLAGARREAETVRPIT